MERPGMLSMRRSRHGCNCASNEADTLLVEHPRLQITELLPRLQLTELLPTKTRPAGPMCSSFVPFRSTLPLSWKARLARTSGYYKLLHSPTPTFVARSWKLVYTKPR
jgi:hypothetical protein